MKFKLSLDTNFCGTNDEIYFESDTIPNDEELEQYAQEWIGVSWEVEEVEEEEEEDYDFENW